MTRDPVVVIGSGASGVHFAQTLLEKGRRVVLIDAGRSGSPPVRPDDDFTALKRNLEDPAAYFLGDDYRALIVPGPAGEYYGFPPAKSYVFEPLERLGLSARGFAPLVSLAAGGLAQAWTGGSYPFLDAELADFPLGYRDLEPAYARVADRIGITGAEDDLARFFPRHGGLLEPLALDEHARVLLETYSRKREHLNRRHGFYMGRSRVAVLSRDHAGRPACSNLGRCLWGCPTGSFYTPSITLDRLRADERLTYLGGLVADHFHLDGAGRVDRVVARGVDGGPTREIEVGTLVLAAGALHSSRLVLESLYRDSGELAELPGLMDNRQVLMPFVNLRMVGRPYEPASYQYHQLALGMEGATPRDYVHGLVTTLKTALIHPIVQNIPAGIATALTFFKNIHAALGLVNINFADWRRDENVLALEPSRAGERPRLLIRYRPPPDEPARLRRTISRFRRRLLSLGCVAPPPLTHVRPMGASVHYAGTLPMMADGGRFTSDEWGRCRAFENVWVVDGAAFPGLPAKNLTFSLMANATRVAEHAF